MCTTTQYLVTKAHEVPSEQAWKGQKFKILPNATAQTMLLAETDTAQAQQAQGSEDAGQTDAPAATDATTAAN